MITTVSYRGAEVNNIVRYCFSVIVICVGVIVDFGKPPIKEIAVATPIQEVIRPENVLLDVPLIRQMDAPRLYNGCEVTSLAMLLNFWGIGVSKNELAERIPRVPLQYSEGKNGNPNVGFVGNMEDGPGLGVYNGPIFQLAQTYINNGLKAENLTNHPFESVLEKTGQGLPVWVITTTNLAPVSTIQTWSTPEGSVDVTYNMHSVVITGYDQENIYINNPYGKKNQKVNRELFIESWQQMGSQAIVIEPVSS
jgi:uncharacterized protein YvpB